MAVSEARVKDLQTSDHLIIKSLEEYDIAASGNSVLFPKGPSVIQRGKIKSHFRFDYSSVASAFAEDPSFVRPFVEVFFCSGHKRCSAYVDRMVSVDGECFAREELMKPELCMGRSDIDDNMYWKIL